MSADVQRVSVKTQHSGDTGQGVVPVLETVEPGHGDVVPGERLEPVLEVDQPQDVDQLEHADSRELMAGVDLPIREMTHKEPAIMDIPAESDTEVREPVREGTPPSVYVEELLRQPIASKPDPKIMSPVKIELPTDPKTLRTLCASTRSPSTERGLRNIIR